MEHKHEDYERKDLGIEEYDYKFFRKFKCLKCNEIYHKEKKDAY